MNDKMGYFDLLNETLSLMTYHMAQMNLKYHSPDVLIEVSRDSCGTYDFYKAEEMIEIGRHAAEKSLHGFRKGMKSEQMLRIIES